MTDFILAIAAYVCLALGVVLLVVRLAGERVARWWGVFRFRRRLRKLDGVPAAWAMPPGPGESGPEEPGRRFRGGHHRRHQNPRTPEDR